MAWCGWLKAAPLPPFPRAASASLAATGRAKRSGRLFGTYGAVTDVGYLLGPFVRGALVEVGGYRALFGSLGVVALVVVVWTARRVPVDVPHRRDRSTLKALSGRTGVTSSSSFGSPADRVGPWLCVPASRRVRLLLRNPGRVLTRDQLLDRIGAPTTSATPRPSTSTSSDFAERSSRTPPPRNYC